MSNIIERVDYFSCGYCKNKLGVMFKNSKFSCVETRTNLEILNIFFIEHPIRLF